MHTQHQTHPPRHLPLLLAALGAIGPFSIDAYLPSMFAIGRQFGASPVAVQQTLTAYLVPFAVMSIFHGAISDSLGRRNVILGGLTVYGFASLGCALAPSLFFLMLFRIIQGGAAGAGMIVGRAIVRDFYSGAQAQRLMSTVTLMFALAPTVAPIIGAWLHVWLGWRSLFFFLVLIAAALWAACWFGLPETLPKEDRHPMRVFPMLRSFRRVLGHPAFVAVCVAVALNFTGFFIYVTSAPQFLIRLLGLRETQFYWLFGQATAGMLCGAWLSRHFAGRKTRLQAVTAGYVLMGAATVGNLLINFWIPPAVPWTVLPIFVYVVGQSLSMPGLTLLALDLFPRNRGLAASCQSLIQSICTACTPSLIAPFLWDSTLHLAAGQAALLGIGAAGFCIFFLLTRHTADAEGETVPAG